MRKPVLLSLALAACMLVVPWGRAQTSLYPIFDDGLWGYIDESGATVIAPRFKAVGHFAEGLAPAREHGLYGYIDSAGAYVIDPVYDFAEPFEGGTAHAYLGDSLTLIDRGGRPIAKTPYTYVGPFDEDGLSTVQTRGGQFGVIDRTGRLVADTVYREITSTRGGLIVYSRLVGEDIFERQEGVLNRAGDVAIAPGVYATISPFEGGRATATVAHTPAETGEEQPRNRHVIIDTSGRITQESSPKSWLFANVEDGFHEGLAAVRFERPDPSPALGDWEDNHYVGAVNTAGQVRFANEDWVELSRFNEGRAFAKTRGAHFYLIDATGKKLNEEPFLEILYDYEAGFLPFAAEVQMVRTARGWCTIDSNGRVSSDFFAPDNSEYNYFTQSGSVLNVERDIQSDDLYWRTKYGYWDSRSGQFVQPFADQGSVAHPTGALLYLAAADVPIYLRPDGTEVWRGTSFSQPIAGFDIDHMAFGHFDAASPMVGEWDRIGPQGDVGNLYVALREDQAPLSRDLHFTIDSLNVARGRPQHLVSLVNADADTAFFSAQDGSIRAVVQALAPDGVWRDIEWRLSSWCGNSYHTLHLAPRTRWRFNVNAYDGAVATKLRVCIRDVQIGHDGAPTAVYSPPFDGAVNPGQFWRKPDYSSSDLMNPYSSL